MPWQGAIKIDDDDIPFPVASLVGCAVMTGVGAAINTAKGHPRARRSWSSAAAASGSR